MNSVVEALNVISVEARKKHPRLKVCVCLVCVRGC
jgi:hypothetical protein